jgi:hypothetical protein
VSISLEGIPRKKPIGHNTKIGNISSAIIPIFLEIYQLLVVNSLSNEFVSSYLPPTMLYGMLLVSMVPSEHRVRKLSAFFCFFHAPFFVFFIFLLFFSIPYCFFILLKTKAHNYILQLYRGHNLCSFSLFSVFIHVVSLMNFYAFLWIFLYIFLYIILYWPVFFNTVLLSAICFLCYLSSAIFWIKWLHHPNN